MMNRQIVVFDLEWTAWEGSLARRWSGPGEHREVVQIGAVHLDRSLNEIGAFETLVQPSKNPILSDYFIGLTRIKQDDVDRRGLSFAQAFRDFLAFVGPSPCAVLSNGSDADVLLENCRLNGVEVPAALGAFRNTRPWLAAALHASDDQIVSSRIPLLIGAGDIAGSHNALHDARCVAAGIRHVCRQLGQVLPDLK